MNLLPQPVPINIILELVFDGPVAPKSKFPSAGLDLALGLMENANPKDGIKFIIKPIPSLTAKAPQPDSDEVWMFGSLDNDPTDKITNVLDAFMNDGNGVFATGDHGSIGSTLCGEVTRVRLMRLGWTSGLPGPGEDNRERRQTSVPEEIHSTAMFFKDSIPQPKPIWPTYYWKAGLPYSLPHELLSLSGNRAIRFLPAHEHEGECTVLGYAPGEFLDVEPVIVARAITTAGTGTSKEILVPTAQLYGVVGAYDGDRVTKGPKGAVGRIVVDSTFHHWLNDDVRELSRTVFADELANYYRNIARWLIPIRKRPTAWMTGFRTAVSTTRFIEGRSEKIKDLAHIGEFVFDAIERASNTQWALACIDSMLGFDSPASPFSKLTKETEDPVKNQMRHAALRYSRHLGLGSAASSLIINNDASDEDLRNAARIAVSRALAEVIQIL